MSYARFGWEGSDVYVYLDVDGYLCCCACRLSESGKSERFDTTAALLDHLKQHDRFSDTVPASTIEELRRDQMENDNWIKDHQASTRGGERQ